MNLDVFKGFDYQPQDSDEEVMLSELPLSIIKDSIKQQFDDPVTYGMNDFVQTFETRYIITKEDMDEENEEEIETLYNTFIVFMRDIFKERLSLGFPELDDMTEEEQLELIHYAYRFFILNIKKNYTMLVWSYIQEYKAEIAEILPKKKNVSTNALREVIEDPDDITIISDMGECINLIVDNPDLTVDDFMKLSRGAEPNLENDFINEKYDDFNINGNFIPQYSRMLDPTTRIEIECNIRNKILSKYRK